MSEERHTDIQSQNAGAGTTDEALKKRRTMRRAKTLTIVVLVVLAAGTGRTVVSRISNARALEASSSEQAAQYVNTALPRSGGAGQTLILPGTLQGFVQSPIAARASGYLRRWHKDIGSRVEKGDLLAELDTPEIDQQLSQAIAARAQTASSLALAKSTLERWEALRQKDAVSQQELDERRSASAQAAANLAAADANVERLRQLESFKRVVAPFAGVITRRNVDVGDLIDAGGGAGRAMFLLAQTDPLRVYINVPQSSAQLIKNGQKAVVTQTELQGQIFQGEVARTSGSIDAATRTMQVEITLRNRDSLLMPGAYVQVSLPLPAGSTLAVPTNALVIRGDGVKVAVVGAENRIQLKPIKIGRNYGQSVEVLDGVTVNDRLVLNPSDSLTDGDQVIPVAPKEKTAEKTAPKAAVKDGVAEK
jgi:RND family efflux transporter MFP subunit